MTSAAGAALLRATENRGAYSAREIPAMAELYAEQAESAPAEGRGATGSGRPGRHKAAAHKARGAQTFTVTSAPAATPTADTVEAMLSGGIPVELVVLAVRTADLARGDTDPVAERGRASDRERTRRASAKAPPTESQHEPPPPELHEKVSVAKPFAAQRDEVGQSNRGIRIPNNRVSDEKWLPSLAENGDEDARQINQNVNGFFAVLAEWSRVARSPRRRTTSTLPRSRNERTPPTLAAGSHWAKQRKRQQ